MAMIIYVAIFAPLLGAILAGFFYEALGRVGSHCLTIGLVALSLAMSLVLASAFVLHHHVPAVQDFYTWASGGSYFPYEFHIGFLIDSLTTLMMVVVTFVSLLVHIYSIGYMADDQGYCRFFAYISLFTFAMLMLVTANNFLQLFFGWEAVGLVSYLLIGFYFKKPSAIHSNFKAFLVNRVGDFGFIIGLALIFANCGTLDYGEVFAKIPTLLGKQIMVFGCCPCSLVTAICLCLYVGAMGKSAQMPLHVWLPESMEGPTPISALIHAATMVTAGVFLIARMSPLFEHSETALSVVLVIGATGALFTGLLGVVMDDIKRVVAYSTLSQLGYMMVAMGISAYSAGMFHLVTHACFKALLFLCAGSVIIGMHHDQDMRNMGGLWRYMPITHLTALIGGLALCAIPPFSGFFSKDTIINATMLSHRWGSHYAAWCVWLGAYVTALYTFRQMCLTFYGQPRMNAHLKKELRESPPVVWIPLVLLAIPSVVLGYVFLEPMLYAKTPWLADAITVLPKHDVLAHMHHGERHPGEMMHHALGSSTFILTLAGMISAWVGYLWMPQLPQRLQQWFKPVYVLLSHKYFFDPLNERALLPWVRALGNVLYRVGDRTLIDAALVNGSAHIVRGIAAVGRRTQSGYLYHYMFTMVMGLLAVLVWIIWR